MFVVKPEAERGFGSGSRLWDKQTIGMGYHYRARYEFILFFEKGKRRLNDLGVADVIAARRIHGGYPAEKPVAVSEILVNQSSQPGSSSPTHSWGRAAWEWQRSNWGVCSPATT